MITALSKYTVQNMLDKFRWGNLTTAQKISILNSAQEEIVTFVNEYTDRKDYIHDIVAAADDLLSPVVAGISGIYAEHIELTFDYNSGTPLISNNSSTIVGGVSIESSSSDLTGDFAVYTIGLSGIDIDGRTEIVAPRINLADVIVDEDTNSIEITVNKNHNDFSLWVRKPLSS